MARIVDREILLGFVEEAQGYLPKISADLDAHWADNLNIDALEEAHRLFHTIKGASSMVGLSGLSHIAYHGEEAIEEVAAGQLPVGDETLAALRQTVACIGTYLEDFSTGSLQERPLLEEIIRIYRRLRGLPVEEDAGALEAALAKVGNTPVLPPPETPALEEAEARRGVESAALEEFASAKPEEITPQPTPGAEARRGGETGRGKTFIPEEVSPDLLETFVIEAEDHLHTISSLLSALDKQPDRKDLLHDIRRSVHTLKGAAGMIGFPSITQLSHRMEDLLDELYEGTQAINTDILALLFASSDLLEDLKNGSGNETALEDVYARYDALLGRAVEEPAAPEVKPVKKLEAAGDETILDLTALAEAKEEAKEVQPAGQARPSQVVRVSLERLDELVRLVSELAISRTSFEQQMADFAHMVQDLQTSAERLRRISVNIETQYEATTLGDRPGAVLTSGTAGPDVRRDAFTPKTHGFDTLEFDRYTEFHRLTRELAEATNDVKVLGGGLHNLIGDFDTILNRQGRLSSEIQDKLMRARMVPLATLATRLHRTVRVVAQEQSKLVELALEGEHIELDKTVLEEMADPLMHLLRNAVDHGIEPPALRQVMGKNERGLIRLRAYYEGNQVVIQVSDDGAGLEPEILRSAAIHGGYVSETDAPRLTNEELYSLIFLPGFSTSTTVSEISGRGVGMDIVRTNVHKLKGSITLDSTPGRGVAFTIRLPMTLAIIRALLVEANHETFAIPLGSVAQILRLARNEADWIGHKPVVRVGGKVYPLLRLGDALHLKQPSEANGDYAPALILNAGARQIALVVDRLIEQRDIVIKTLGSLLGSVRGVIGATLMGDGSVVLILNVGDLVGEGGAEAVRGAEAMRGAEAVRGGAETRRSASVGAGAAQRSTGDKERLGLSVMIVDDSPSVRRVVSNLISNAGWQPITAKDGLEALQLIQQSTQLPDLILLDIEMPRMDGYELTATLKAQEAYRAIPIVMLTSRAGEKHHQKAMEIGVTEYLVKPYQDEMLLNIVRRLARSSPESAHA